MTAGCIVEIVEQIDRGSKETVRCIAMSQLRSVDFEAWQQRAYTSARYAGHYANQLIDLAERGERTAA